MKDGGLLERERKRLTAIYLSSVQRLKINEIAAICEVSSNSIKSWFNKYESGGFGNLLDKNMAHKTSYLSTQNESVILSCVEQNPQNLNIVVADLATHHQIVTTKNQLKNYLKKRI